MRSATQLLLLSALALTGIGCNRNPFVGAQQPFAWQQSQAQPGQPLPEHVSQLQDLNRRNSQLDLNNNDLHRQLAQAQQDNQVKSQQVELLQKQLKEVTDMAREATIARKKAEEEHSAFLASTRQRGGAVITANNSLRGGVSKLNLPGVEVREDGEVLRIELPADQLFQLNTAQLTASASPLLQQVAQAVRQNFPRQKIVVEGHTDNNPLGGGVMSSKVRLTLAQASAVFDQLTTTYGMPARQFAVTGHGDNYPLASNATPAGQEKNRRVEIVIAPESID
ncbi:MAG: OmpA family protein [Pirellulaceae bacterium]